jgi:hypothetical protein
MSGKEDVKGKQDSEKSRGAEEKIKAWNSLTRMLAS